MEVDMEKVLDSIEILNKKITKLEADLTKLKQDVMHIKNKMSEDGMSIK